jgi:hypothetical protein
MKTLITSLLLIGAVLTCSAVTTINTGNRYAWCANAGWMDWRNNVNFGVTISEYVCSGNAYTANLGWINFGNGSPTNGIQYLNLAATDFGVNLVSQNLLRGYAYGANIGWIAFEPMGNPQINLATGHLSGYAWSANVGWISLTNEFAVVQTDYVWNGIDTDGDGMADAWERLNFGSTAASPNADPDGDGATNLQEYGAGTNPNDASDVFRITNFTKSGDVISLGWKSVPTRNYLIDKTPAIKPASWSDSGLGSITPGGLNTSRTFSDTDATMKFYRVRAFRPLSP